jgi:hypothetical protein
MNRKFSSDKALVDLHAHLAPLANTHVFSIRIQSDNSLQD